MSWAADRQTTRTEDRAYCLLGLFDINMPLLYGEGMRAFQRLQEEILKSSDDQSILAWGPRIQIEHTKDLTAGPDNERGNSSNLLAPTPASFRGCGDIVAISDGRFSEPFQHTNRGLTIRLPIIKCGDYQVGLLACKFHSDTRACYLGILLVQRSRLYRWSIILRGQTSATLELRNHSLIPQADWQRVTIWNIGISTQGHPLETHVQPAAAISSTSHWNIRLHSDHLQRTKWSVHNVIICQQLKGEWHWSRTRSIVHSTARQSTPNPELVFLILRPEQKSTSRFLVQPDESIVVWVDWPFVDEFSPVEQGLVAITPRVQLRKIRPPYSPWTYKDLQNRSEDFLRLLAHSQTGWVPDTYLSGTERVLQVTTYRDDIFDQRILHVVFEVKDRKNGTHQKAAGASRSRIANEARSLLLIEND